MFSKIGLLNDMSHIIFTEVLVLKRRLRKKHSTCNIAHPFFTCLRSGDLEQTQKTPSLSNALNELRSLGATNCNNSSEIILSASSNDGIIR